MTKDEKSKIKYRMKRLARKFCRRNSVYNYVDSCVWELIEKAYFSAYLLCLHENKQKIVELERKLEQTEKDLSDYQFNYPTIIELEKEKAEFKEQLARITEERNGYKTTVKSYEHTIKDSRKENVELKNRDCWKSCEYANTKAELIGQHIKDVQNLTKAKDLLAKWVELYEPKLKDFPKTPMQEETERFLKEIGK